MMTPEAQRIAIAEACGIDTDLCYTSGHCLADGIVTIPEMIPEAVRGMLPDYLGDLNAMHEAEKHAAEHLMNGDQWEEYGRKLERMHPQACVKATDGSIDYYDLATLLTDLTAAQRAEAFLRTLGLWT